MVLTFSGATRISRQTYLCTPTFYRVLRVSQALETGIQCLPILPLHRQNRRVIPVYQVHNSNGAGGSDINIAVPISDSHRYQHGLSDNKPAGQG
eukprot:gene8586-biopygen14741